MGSPDREKIAQLQASFNHPDVTLNQIQAEWNKPPDEQFIIRDDDIEEYYKQADQIRALFDEEEIRKQEGERIRNWGEEDCPHVNQDDIKHTVRRECRTCWQALKESDDS